MRFERFQRVIVTLVMIAFAGSVLAAVPTATPSPKTLAQAGKTSISKPGVKKPGANPAAAKAKATPKPKHTPPAVIEPPTGTWKIKLTTESLVANVSKTRPTLVMLSAAWCPFCKKMKKDVFPTTTVQAALTNWDLVYIDTDTYRMMEPQAQNRSIPFYLLFDKNGKEISRFTHEMTAEQFAAWTDDVYARIGELEGIDAALKAKPDDPQLLSRRANALIGIALKIQNVDSRITVRMPGHMKEAMEAAKKAVAAGDTSAELKNQMRLMEIIQQYLNGDLAGASSRLDKFAQASAKSDFESDAFFWKAVFTMKKNASPTRSHDEASDKMFEDYLKKYPTGRYADAAGHRLETVMAAIEKVIKDSQKKAKEERAKIAKEKLAKEKAAKKAAQDAKKQAAAEPAAQPAAN